MKISHEIAKYLSGITFTYKNNSDGVNTHYGDNKELISWILSKGDNKKYPLIWVVETPYKVVGGWHETETDILILQNTQHEWLNTKRKEDRYDLIIDPISELVKKKLNQSMYIQVVGERYNKFNEKDEPNYGVDTDELTSQSSFKSTTKKGQKGVTIDLVDAKIIRCKLRININCLN